MNELDDLIAQREKIREQEKELTASIKQERARLAEQKKADSDTEKLKKLREEHAVLAALCAALLKDKGVTYKVIGEKLNCSPGHAAAVVKKAFRILRHPSRYNVDTE
jgi:small-conductance mechanosensitive channel